MSGSIVATAAACALVVTVISSIMYKSSTPHESSTSRNVKTFIGAFVFFGIVMWLFSAAPTATRLSVNAYKNILDGEPDF